MTEQENISTSPSLLPENDSHGYKDPVSQSHLDQNGLQPLSSPPEKTGDSTTQDTDTGTTLDLGQEEVSTTDILQDPAAVSSKNSKKKLKKPKQSKELIKQRKKLTKARIRAVVAGSNNSQRWKEDSLIFFDDEEQGEDMDGSRSRSDKIEVMNKVIEDRERHEYWMRRAIEMAELALCSDETPVGCVFVHNDTIIGRGMNGTNASLNGTRHAEFVAISQIVAKYPLSILHETDLYVTVEPCIMCASALRQYGIRAVYFGCLNERFGGCGGVMRLNSDPSPDPPYAVFGGLFREEAIMLLRRFYVQENGKAPEPKPKKNRELKTEILPIEVAHSFQPPTTPILTNVSASVSEAMPASTVGIPNSKIDPPTSPARNGQAQVDSTKSLQTSTSRNLPIQFGSAPVQKQEDVTINMLAGQVKNLSIIPDWTR